MPSTQADCFAFLCVMGAIQFFKEDVRFRLPAAAQIPAWINRVVRGHGKKAGDINFIFCSDPYLRKMNTRYLSHRTYTDILTFDTAVEKDVISGDIFISVDRVSSNAVEFHSTFRDELHRVMIHGVLHLLGYDDATDSATRRMRKAEDDCLAKRKFRR